MFISVKINTRITLLLISFVVLDSESLDSAEVFSLCFSLLELVVAIIGLTGGVDMVSISIVVGIGCYGGRPNNRVRTSKLKAIPLKELKINRAGSTPAPPPIAALTAHESRRVGLLCGF